MKKKKASLSFVALSVLLTLYGTALAQWTEPVPVMEVNTEYREYRPFLSHDGLSLYFTRGKTASFYCFRAYEATRDEPFGPFTAVREVLRSSGGHIMSPWVSPDNLRMYYHKESSAGWRLKVSERASVDDPWPQGVDIPELNALGKIHSPRLTPDELIIFFDSPAIPGGHGGYDIWMATRPDRNSPFDNVRNLEEINTAANEGGPFISPDGLTLYFGLNRNGSSQLFRATRQSLDEPFGAPEHLSFFDTPGGGSGHPSLSSDGTALYFVRTTSERLSDIWVSYLVRHEVAVDIKPGSCPNPLNIASRGVLPVAVLGTEHFDVNTIDVASIRLAGVGPIRSRFEDVATPVSDGNDCECNTEGPEGYTDLTLKFKTQQIVEELLKSLGELVDGEELVLTLTGVLSDGTPIEGADCVVVVGKVPKPLAAKSSDVNGDGIVNIFDFAIIAQNWLEPAAVEY